MTPEIIYILTIWTTQAILYTLLTFKFVSWKLKKSKIFWTAFGLIFITPWLFPVDGGYNPDTGKYICGMAGLGRVLAVWVIGNFGSLVLVLAFAGLGLIRKKLNQPYLK